MRHEDCDRQGPEAHARGRTRRTTVFYLAESLGGVESLIEHPASMTHAALTPEDRAAIGLSDPLLRLSVGVEDPEDLIEDALRLATELGNVRSGGATPEWATAAKTGLIGLTDTAERETDEAAGADARWTELQRALDSAASAFDATLQNFRRGLRAALKRSHPDNQKLRAEKVIKGFGIGVNDPVYAARYLREGDFDCLLLAGRYSLLEQPALSEVLPIARQKNVGVLLGGVFNSGILATGAVPGAKYNYTPAPPAILERVRRIETVCAGHGVPLPVAAMHFALAGPAVSSLVLGAVAPDEVERNVAAISAAVPAGLWADLKAAGLLDASAPTPGGT